LLYANPKHSKGVIVFICICNGITEKHIRDAVCCGADDLGELRAQLGVGAGCGTCTAFAEQILSETIEQHGFLENRAVA
jgi:bacterioferritin-associated ferredoxin